MPSRIIPAKGGGEGREGRGERTKERKKENLSGVVISFFETMKGEKNRNEDMINDCFSYFSIFKKTHHNLERLDSTFLCVWRE